MPLVFVVPMHSDSLSLGQISIGNSATNLWILFQKVTEEFSFTMNESELFRNFMGDLQKKVDLIFTPPVSIYGIPEASRRRNRNRRKSSAVVAVVRSRAESSGAF